jgi:hypothetical protein
MSGARLKMSCDLCALPALGLAERRVVAAGRGLHKEATYGSISISSESFIRQD